MKFAQYNGTTINGVQPLINVTAIVSSALLVLDAGAAAAVTFGPDNNGNFDTINPGQTYQIPIPAGKWCNLADFNIKAVAAYNYRILYLPMGGP